MQRRLSEARCCAAVTAAVRSQINLIGFVRGYRIDRDKADEIAAAVALELAVKEEERKKAEEERVRLEAEETARIAAEEAARCTVLPPSEQPLEVDGIDIRQLVAEGGGCSVEDTAERGMSLTQLGKLQSHLDARRTAQNPLPVSLLPDCYCCCLTAAAAAGAA